MAEPYPGSETESNPPGVTRSGAVESLSVVEVAAARPQTLEEPHAYHGEIWWAAHGVVLEGLDAVAAGLRIHGPRAVGLLLTGLSLFVLGALSMFVLGVPPWTLALLAVSTAVVSTAVVLWRRR